jgi:ribosomal protein S18 acetylase RimI-like enzyme
VGHLGETLNLLVSSHFPSFREELCRAAEATLPGLGFNADEVARFLSQNAEPFSDTHYLLRDDDRTVSVAMCCGDLLEYVLPMGWEGRSEAVTQTISALKAIHPTLRLRISEDTPSHSDWYSALLPSLGFEMVPRFRMTAPTAVILKSNLGNKLDPEYKLATLATDQFEACLDLYLSAYDLSDRSALEMESNLRGSLEIADRLRHWTVVFHGQQLVGSCFTSHHRGRIFVEELAVSKRHRMKGIGRLILLESILKTAADFPEAGTVVLDVDRIKEPAVRLYTALGFSILNRYIAARLI